jgi:hypothetical protein
MLTQQQGRGGPRRLRAAIIGLGLDGPVRPLQIVQSEDCVLIGGSERTRAEMLETMLRLEAELERLGCRLGDLEPAALVEIARRIDSPELEAIAARLSEGLDRLGRSFAESTPEELTAIAIADDGPSATT